MFMLLLNFNLNLAKQELTQSHMLPSKRHHSLKLTYEAKYNCSDEGSRKRECRISSGNDQQHFLSSSSRKIRALQIPLSSSDAIVPNSSQVCPPLQSKPSTFKSPAATDNNTCAATLTPDHPMVVGKLPTINVSKDATQHQPVDKTLSQTSHVLGSSNKQPICVECDYVPLSGNSALLGIKELLKCRLNKEVGKFQSSLSHAIIEELEYISQQPVPTHYQSFHQGYTPEHKHSFYPDVQPILPDDELLLEDQDWRAYTNDHNELEFEGAVGNNQLTTADFRLPDIEHQLDHYTMRLLTAALTINSSLKNST